MRRSRSPRLRTKVSHLGVSIALAAMVLTPAMSVLAPAQVLADTCPTGWTEVDDADLSTLSLFCRKQIAILYPDAYFIKVAAQHIGQWLEEPEVPCEQYAGSSIDPNPEVQKRTVSDWLDSQMDCGWYVGLAFNGTFFAETDDEVTTSEISYPLLSSSPGMITGYETDPNFPRVCFGFGGSGAEPGAADWDLGNTDWLDTWYEFNGTPPDGCGFDTYHKLVGVDPSITIGSDRPRTYMGTSNTSSTDTCILVGGKFSPANVASVFSDFGCTAEVQLDGGNSSQLSYWDGDSIVDAVTSYTYLLGGSRLVPHALFIFR